MCPPSRPCTAPKRTRPASIPSVRRQPAVRLGRRVEGRPRHRAPSVDLLQDAPLEELPEGRHADHRRGPRRAQPLGDPVARALVQVDHARAAREREEQAARELEGVVERQDAQRRVAARQREDGRERGDERREVRVREHHALGPRRRAARVEEARDVARLDRDRRRRERRLTGRGTGRSVSAWRSSARSDGWLDATSARASTVSSHTTARASLSREDGRPARARRAPDRPGRRWRRRARSRSTRSPSPGGSAPRGRRGRPSTPRARRGARPPRRRPLFTSRKVVRVRPSARHLLERERQVVALGHLVDQRRRSSRAP